MKLLLATIILFISSLANPHSGGLDSYGCHNNRKQGSYHCHQDDNKGESYSSKSEMLDLAGKSTEKETEADNSKKKN